MLCDNNSLFVKLFWKNDVYKSLTVILKKIKAGEKSFSSRKKPQVTAIETGRINIDPK